VSQGKAICIVLGNDRPASTESTAAIIKAVARARMWYDEIVAGEVNSIPEIAKKHGVTPSYVKRIFPCALLGPASVEAILNGKTSMALTLDHLLGNLPSEWDQQCAARAAAETTLKSAKLVTISRFL
jgi:hypothetical protein